jgi:small conductance mechanosensitive channel
VLTLLTIRDVLQGILDFLRLDVAELGRRLIQVAFIWIFGYLVWRLVNIIARKIVQAVDDGDDSTMTEAEQRGHTVSQLLRSVGRVVIIGIALLLTLNVFINIGPLLAGAGILGLAVSFGAQSLVKDVISGFFFLIENQFAVGDVIEVAGKSGVVERMTLRVVMLRDAQGTVHTVPNGQITTVSNMTRKWSRAVVDVDVDYETDIDRALEILRDEARRFGADPAWRSRLDGDPEVLGVEALAENGMRVRSLLRTHPGAQWDVAREFRRRLKTRLSAEGIDLPRPQRVVHLRNVGTPGASRVTE